MIVRVLIKPNHYCLGSLTEELELEQVILITSSVICFPLYQFYLTFHGNSATLDC